MSPEQASAADVDERADVWAIGAVAYDLLEGHPPFDGPNDLARLNALVRGGLPAPFSSEVPEPIERTIFKALDRDLEKRYRTAAELRDAFETALAESGMRTSHDDVAQDLKSLWSSELMVEAPSDRSDGPSVRDLLLPQGQPTTEARAIPESVSLPLVPAPIRGRRVALGVVGVLTAAGLAAWWSSTKPNETESSRTRPTESTAPAPSSVPLPAASLPAPQDTPSASSAAASAQPSAAPAPPAALPSATAPTPMPARKSAAKPAATAGPTTKPRSTTPKPTATDDEDGIF